MNKTSAAFGLLACLSLGVAESDAALAWTLGNPTAGRGTGDNDERTFYGDTGTVFFAQEQGATNGLPGNPANNPVNQQADDDYYFSGVYTNQVDGGAVYAPVGLVGTHELTLERAVVNTDGRNRFHFNFSAVHATTDVFNVTFKMLDLDDNGTGTGQYDFSLFVNGVNLGNFSHTVATIPTPFVSDPFTLADVGGTAGAPDDNYVELIATNPGSSARWSNFDYIRLDYTPVPEPTSLGFLAVGAGSVLLMRRRRR